MSQDMDSIKLAIWGIGLYETFLKTAFDLTKPAGLELVCRADDRLPENMPADGLKVVTTEELASLYARGEVHAVILAVHHSKLAAVSSALMLKGILDLYYFPHYTYDYTLDRFSYDLLERIEVGKPRLSYLEFHLADHCNLNCKGCAHLSNITEPHLTDLSQFRKDLIRLGELFWGIERVRIMGGEPLLNEELPEYVKLVRETFPDADMHIVSNGLLINPGQQELFRVMRENHCSFNISLYPPAVKLKDRIQAVCALYGVRCLFTDPVRIFRTTFDPGGENDPENSYRHCDVTHCTFLKDGRLSNCITPFLLPQYEKLYGVTLPVPEGDIIDLYEEGLTGVDIMEKLAAPIKTCRYCDPEHTHAYYWEIAGKDRAKPEDYLSESARARLAAADGRD
ncbi:MAG: radical SAM protein [Lachnospiraceae bacterium]|nr:radical SAM protein [Lachnospiraceae bacterium]